jgi:alpha-mannosidase
MVFNSYFEAKFGNRYETVWLPNSFGITGAYPQLLHCAR